MHKQFAALQNLRLIRMVTIVVALVGALLFFFRHPLQNNFSMLYGDSYDAVIEVAILNHWYNVFVHGASWITTGYFYPHAGTLGYNDTYIVPGGFFTLGRLAGLDPFLATLVSYVGMKVIGFGGMYLLLRRPLQVSHAVALFGAVLFTVAGSTLIQLTHGQLLSLGLIPWLAYLLIGTVESLQRGSNLSLLVWGSSLAVLFALCALNAFYFSWFFCFFLLVAAPFYFASLRGEERNILIAATRQRVLPLAAILGVAVVALIPFSVTYLPKLAESGGHSWSGIAELLPTPGTLINVGRGNMLWGQLNQRLFPSQDFSTEDQVGFGPLTLIALIAAAVYAHRNAGTTHGRFVMVLFSAVLVALVLTLKVNGVSLWWAVYQIVPGAGGVRAVTRFCLFALVPITMILALWIEHLRSSGKLVFAAAAMGLLLGEQVQLTPPLNLNRGEQLRLLQSVPPPPTACEAFFVVALQRARLPTSAFSDATTERRIELFGLYRHNVDAMLLASLYNRPTIIGFSSFNPPDWNFSDPWRSDYLERVRSYARKHNINPLCGYDYRRTPGWFTLK